MSNNVLAIDIGSSKIVAVIASVSQNNISVLGVGAVSSQGVKKGVISNIDLASKALKQALNEATKQSGIKPSKAIVSISEANTQSIQSKGFINIPKKEISKNEMQRVMNKALNEINIPNDYQLIHMIPNSFKLDEQDFVEDPCSMLSSSMEVNVTAIVTQKVNIANLTKTISLVGLDIENIVTSGYASSLSSLSTDEKSLGTAVLNLGSGYSSISITTNSTLRYSKYLPVGSNHITNDISIGLNTPYAIAENIKLRHANLIEGSSETIEVPRTGDEEKRNTISFNDIHQIVFARVEETLILLSKILENSQLKDNLGAGIVITGGMSKLKGLKELAQTVFTNMPIRIINKAALQIDTNGYDQILNHPSFSTVIGLLLHTSGQHIEYEMNFKNEILAKKDSLEEDAIGIAIPEDLDDIIKNEEELENDDSGEFTLPPEEPKSKNPIKRMFNWGKSIF